jgi:hypothetical protein
MLAISLIVNAEKVCFIFCADGLWIPGKAVTNRHVK